MLPARVSRLLEHFVSATARLDSALRRAAAARAAATAGGAQALDGPTDLPPPLAGWVDKVARHAYRCTDEDVGALKAAGYDEDQIYEATIAAAMGAATARLERGLALLRGARR